MNKISALATSGFLWGRQSHIELFIFTNILIFLGHQRIQISKPWEAGSLYQYDYHYAEQASLFTEVLCLYSSYWAILERKMWICPTKLIRQHWNASFLSPWGIKVGGEKDMVLGICRGSASHQRISPYPQTLASRLWVSMRMGHEATGSMNPVPFYFWIWILESIDFPGLCPKSHFIFL